MGEQNRDLEGLFKRQIQTLQVRDCPMLIILDLQSQQEKVLAKASEMTFEEGRIPFLPVIPLTRWSLQNLMAMVEYKGMIGHLHLNPNHLRNKVDSPQEPYLIFDVEDGEAMLNKSLQDVERLIGEQGRSCLTVAEAVALCTHTNVLSRHCVDAAGSHNIPLGRVPYLGLSVGDGAPMLNRHSFDTLLKKWGSPSCAERIRFL